MRFMKRVAGWLRLGHNNHDHDHDQVNQDDQINNNLSSGVEDDNDIKNDYGNVDVSTRKGFSVKVKVKVKVEKGSQIGPVLSPCPAGDGGVQGLAWYTQSLKMDEDGDVADEFLEEVFLKTTSYPNTNELHQTTSSNFKTKLNAKPARARNPCLSSEGTVQHYVKYQGQQQLIG